MKHKVFLYLFCAYIFFTSCTNPDSFIPQQGDLLFQDLDCGPLCDAIESVTTSYGNYHFSHLGLVFTREDDSLFVIEAIGDKVQATPLHKFLYRNIDASGNPKVVAMRSTLSQNEVKRAIQLALQEIDKPYDDYFLPDNNRWYCSELIAYAFNTAARRIVFANTAMTYKFSDTDSIMPVWKDYFDKLNVPVPEGVPGCNPGGMSRSAYVKLVHAYY